MSACRLLAGLAGAAVLTLPAGPALAAGARAEAAQAYRTGRYDDGIRALRAELARLPARPSPERAEALYLLGRLELRKGELALELARASRRYSADHLARLASGRTRLRLPHYFLGVARLEAGDRGGAASAFRAVLRAIPARAKGDAGVVRRLAGLKLRALSGRAASLAPGADPRVAAEAALLVAASGAGRARGLAAAEAALGASRRKGRTPPPSVVRAVAAARLAAGRIDEALSLIEKPWAHRPAAVERAGPLLSVEYYDVPALGTLAEANLRAAARDFEAALAAASGGSAALREAAALGLARARLLTGDPDGALAAVAPLERPATLGPAGAARVAALAGHAAAARGDTGGAVRFWQSALEGAGGDPVALGELAAAVAEGKARDAASRALAGQVLDAARAAADAAPRRAPQPLAAGAGLLVLEATGDAAAAVAEYERGRDKASKNRIDANDPIFLARLALAQVGARQFSEALEIYFEMGKTYPEVRQVQEALQGVYAAEQVAGGEVRIN